jgi:hypothetical protein
MEPTTAKPTRKRRRWLLAAFILVLVSLGSWWLWPRGDVRFVGKWAAYPNANSTQPTGTFDFRSNGTGWFDWSGVTYFTVWDTQDERLHFGLRFAESRLVSRMKSITGPMTWMTTMGFEIESANEETIILRNGPAFQPNVVLRRIPQ